MASIEGVEAEFARNVNRTLLVLPTGAGKTVVFSELIRRTLARTGKRALVLAHRTELLKQAQRKLLDVGVHAGIEKAELRAGHAPVVVASVQTLKGKRLARLRPEDFGVLVVDEAHHSTAPSYREILDHFGVTPTLGVTATPDRADGTAMREVYSTIAYRYELRQAIRDGWLAPIRARRIRVSGLDLSSVKTRAGDLAQDELAKIMSAESVLHGVASPLVEQAGDRKTMVFTVDVANAYALANVLNRYKPDSARAIDGTLGDDARAELLSEFSRGAFQFLVSCALLLEGFDEPSVACIASCRPTKSRALYTQMVGRGTRLFPGKSDCLLLDMVGNSGRHKLVGPLDALAAGEITDDVREAAERDLAKGAKDLEQAILDAEQAQIAKRAEVKATVRAHYFAHEIDPFIGDQLRPVDANAPAWTRELATPDQIRALVDAGISSPPIAITRGEASAMLDAIAERHRLGLATIKQRRLLEKLKLDTRGMTKARASELFMQAKRGGFKPWSVMHEPEARRGIR